MLTRTYSTHIIVLFFGLFLKEYISGVFFCAAAEAAPILKVVWSWRLLLVQHLFQCVNIWIHRSAAAVGIGQDLKVEELTVGVKVYSTRAASDEFGNGAGIFLCQGPYVCVNIFFWMLCIDYLIRLQAVANKPLPSVQELSIVKFQIFRKAYGKMHISIHNCSVNVSGVVLLAILVRHDLFICC